MLIDANELRERLEKAMRELTALRDDRAIEDHEYLRLSGKVAGIKRALSYIADAERAPATDDLCPRCAGKGGEHTCDALGQPLGPPEGAPTRALTGGLRMETRPIPTSGLVLPTGDGEVFVDYATLEALTEVSATDLAFEFVQGPYVDHDAAKALVAAGLARQSTRGSYYGTDALKALLLHL